MAADLIDLVGSLIAITREETDRCSAPGRHADLREMADAKARLVAAMEARVAALTRERPDWMRELEPDLRDRLTACVSELQEAAIANARVLKRHIELTTEMMAAVAAEAQRLTGARNATYGVRGTLFRTDQPAPISLNTRL